VDKLTAAFGGAQKGINSLQDTDDTEITGTDDDRSALFSACRLLAGMYDDNGPNDGGVAEINLLAAKIAIIDGDMAKGKVFAARAMREFTVEQGADCRVVAKQGYLASDPTRFVLHGIVSPRPTKVSDIPTNLSDDDFEDWLWGPFLLQQMALGVPLETELAPEISEGVHTTNTTNMANLRDQTIFPTWTGLPHEEGLDPSPYHAAVDKGGVFTPMSHWCLLGKITSYFRLRRLEIYVEDLSGRTFHLIFRTDACGGEVPHNLLVKGNAVAVLYPVRYTNMLKHRGSGIQVNESGMIKVSHTTAIVANLGPKSTVCINDSNTKTDIPKTSSKPPRLKRQDPTILRCSPRRGLQNLLRMRYPETSRLDVLVYRMQSFLVLRPGKFIFYS